MTCHPPPSRLTLPALLIASLAANLALGLGGCAGTHTPGPATLIISEVMASNDGAYLDEEGETEDFIELANRGTEPVELSDFSLADQGRRERLPSMSIPPGAVLVLFADDEPDEGERHLNFKLSAGGDSLTLYHHGHAGARVVDEVRWEDLEPNQSLARFGEAQAFERCGWASPARVNGDRCGPPPPPPDPVDDVFADYTWPAPQLPTPLSLSELALRPAAFVEVRNTGSGDLSLNGYVVRVAPHGPNLPWPGASDGAALPLSGTLAAGERASVQVEEAALMALSPTLFEGVVSLFAADGTLVDRVDFMHWPTGAVLARAESAAGTWGFRTAGTEAGPNDSPALASRAVGAYVRHLYTPGDYDALSAGGTSVGQAAVKFLLDIDVAGGSLGYLLSTARYPLHFDFVDQVFAGGPVYDRCDAQMNQQHRSGWQAFSVAEYYCGETRPAEDLSCTDAERRYMMGTLVHHTGPDLHTLEMVSGDRASSQQMLRTYFEGAALTDDPSRYWMRPQSQAAVDKLRDVEGQLPIIGRGAPFVGVRQQALNPGVAYGTLTFVSATELPVAVLGPRVVLITDSVPNDIGFVGGLITEALQTPLSHVNVLSQNRGTPNLALLGARDHASLAPLLGQLVRLEVTESGFTVEPAALSEAQAHWQSLMPSGPPQTPARDLTLRGVQDLRARQFSDLPAIGGKAAQFAELYRITFPAACTQAAQVPQGAFAIPIAHYVDHFVASGASTLLNTAMVDARFEADPLFRREALASVRAAILTHPMDAALLAQVEAEVGARFGADTRVRYRSSSNTEDLPGFNGAGLYTSQAATLSDDGSIHDAIRAVWASLWSERAQDERSFFRIDASLVAMGVLVHAAFDSEEGSGIVVTRSVHDATRSDVYTFNVQEGEASVANPAPGVLSEQLDYRWGRTPRTVNRTFSTFSPEVSILSADEACNMAYATKAIHDHFRTLLDPTQEQMYFAMEVEVKFFDGTRALFVKQARPYPFAEATLPMDCRGF